MIQNMKRLEFTLPDKPFGGHLEEVKKITSNLKELTRGAGTNNKKFDLAYERLVRHVKSKKNLANILLEKIDVRALSVALTDSKVLPYIKIDKQALEQVTNCYRNKISSLFYESLYQYYLQEYDNAVAYKDIASWLLHTQQGMDSPEIKELVLSKNAPERLARRAIENKLDFDHQLRELELNNYASGRFMMLAKSIYYVQQLKNIPANEPHELLDELQKESVYDSRYDGSSLLGHKALEVLIRRAPDRDINDSWRDAIIAIAGDPRISPSNKEYIKWWQPLDKRLIHKVRGWLSKLDLGLFLEAIEDYAQVSGDEEIQRMYPSRKSFLMGLIDADLVKHTRLYLSKDAERHIRRIYPKEHLPSFSKVVDKKQSVIYVELENAHIIEGSHECSFWIYRKLDETATVNNYHKTREEYRKLTLGLNEAMKKFGCEAYDHFHHSPQNYSWQKKAIDSLNKLGVSVSPKDVLSEDDYKKYKRLHGVRS